MSTLLDTPLLRHHVNSVRYTLTETWNTMSTPLDRPLLKPIKPVFPGPDLVTHLDQEIQGRHLSHSGLDQEIQERHLSHSDLDQAIQGRHFLLFKITCHILNKVLSTALLSRFGWFCGLKPVSLPPFAIKNMSYMELFTMKEVVILFPWHIVATTKNRCKT